MAQKMIFDLPCIMDISIYINCSFKSMAYIPGTSQKNPCKLAKK